MRLVLVILSAISLTAAVCRGDAVLCGLLIAGHFQRGAVAAAEPMIRELLGEAGIPAANFFARYPSNELYQRALAALLAEGRLKMERLAGGSEIPPTLLREALAKQIQRLLLAEASHDTPGWQLGLVRAPENREEPLDAILERDFRSLRYSDFLRVVSRALEVEFRAACEGSGENPDSLGTFLTRDGVEERALRLLFDLYQREPAIFTRDRGAGARIAREIARDLVLLIQTRNYAAPTREARQVESGNAVYRALMAAGWQTPGEGVRVNVEVWTRAIQEVEVRLIAAAGRPALAHHRVLELAEPGFTANDLGRGLLFETLHWRSRGRALEGTVASHRIAGRAAEDLLRRRGVPLLKDGATAPAPVEPPADSPDGALRTEGLFFFSVLGPTDSRELRTEAERLARETCAEEAFETVWQHLDLRLALHFAHRPSDAPTSARVRALLPRLIEIIGNRLKRGRAHSEERGRQLNAVPAMRRWRAMALHIPFAVARLSTAYQLAESTFWQRYSESDVLEQVGEEAARFAEKDYDSTATAAALGRAAVRWGIRRMVLALAKERRVTLAQNWPQRLEMRSTDTFAVFALADSDLKARALALWRLEPGSAATRANFAKVYESGDPPVALAKEQDIKLGELDYRRVAGFDRFMQLYRVVSVCPTVLSDDAIATRGPLVFRAERRIRELTLTYLSRRTRMSIVRVMRDLEDWAGTKGTLSHVDEKEWPIAVDEVIRARIGARVVGQGTDPVPVRQIYRNEDVQPVVPPEMLIKPVEAVFDDEAWRAMMLRLPDVVDSEAKKFSLTAALFWRAEGGRYEPAELKRALVAEMAAWRSHKFKGHGQLSEEIEVLKRTVRNLCARLFHDRRASVVLAPGVPRTAAVPENVDELIALHQLDRVDVVLMIPPDEFRAVHSAWVRGLGEVWKDDPKDRAKLFNDLFVLDVPKNALAKRNPSFPDDHDLFNRRTRYFVSFMALYRKWHDPTQQIAVAFPPEPCPYSCRVWGLVQQEVGRRLEAISFLGSSPDLFWAELNARHTRHYMAKVIEEEIDKFPKRSTSDDTQRRHAGRIGERVTYRLLRAPIVVSPLPVTVFTPEVTPRTEILPPVEGESSAAPSGDTTPVPTTTDAPQPRPRRDRPTVLRPDPTSRTPSRAPDPIADEEPPDPLPVDPTPPSGSGEGVQTPIPDGALPSPEDEPEITDGARTATELPKDAEPYNVEDMQRRLASSRAGELVAPARDIARDVVRYYGIIPAVFWKSLGGRYTDEEATKVILAEAEEWKRLRYGELNSLSEVFEVRERAIRKLATDLGVHPKVAYPKDWEDALKKKTADPFSLVDRVPVAEKDRLLREWETSGADGELLGAFRRVYIVREPIERTMLPDDPSDEQYDAFDKEKSRSERGFQSFMERWVVLLPAP